MRESTSTSLQTTDEIPGTEPLTEAAAFAHIAQTAFRIGRPSRFGVEVEWLTSHGHDPHGRVHPELIESLLTTRAALPRHSSLTFEPGGGLELSSAPATSIDGCVEEVGSDLAPIVDALADSAVTLGGVGLDPVRRPRRMIHAPRYQAMEQYFDRSGRAGRWMMANTASVQVCLDAGTDTGDGFDYRRRWELAHELGPVLVAAFANSAVKNGEPTRWQCMRQSVWGRIDPTRTAPPAPGDPRENWANYALDAHVMAIRGEAPWHIPNRLSFRDWIRSQTVRPPTGDDLEFHLSTLFPPIRPRGYLEFRMIDSQPGDDWIVPLAVVGAIFQDATAADRAQEALQGLGHPASSADVWWRSAHDGMRHTPIARAALDCFTAARDGLTRLGTGRLVLDRVDSFIERHVSRGRSPADDMRDALT